MFDVKKFRRVIKVSILIACIFGIGKLDPNLVTALVTGLVAP